MSKSGEMRNPACQIGSSHGIELCGEANAPGFAFLAFDLHTRFRTLVSGTTHA